MMKAVTAAVLGTGNMAAKMVRAMKRVPSIDVAAVASRQYDSAQRFAQTHDIPKAYGSYEAAITDRDVTLVYIATPHPWHYEWIKKALLGGKHVLCEKPMTMNASQAAELFTLAKEKQLFLSEAMWTRFLPAVDIVLDILASGQIGKVRELRVSIGYPMTDIPRMTALSLGGGILLDCGIYALTTALLLMGETVADIQTTAHLSDNGVDWYSHTRLLFENGTTADIAMAMDALLDNDVTVIGDRGKLHFEVPFCWQNLTVTTENGEKPIALPALYANGYGYMLEAVSAALRDGALYCAQSTPKDTLTVLRLMDELRARWGMCYPCETDV